MDHICRIDTKMYCVKGESNPQLNLGRVSCYHYTIDASVVRSKGISHTKRTSTHLLITIKRNLHTHRHSLGGRVILDTISCRHSRGVTPYFELCRRSPADNLHPVVGLLFGTQKTHVGPRLARRTQKKTSIISACT